MRVRVKESSKARFLAAAEKVGLSESEAHRTALVEWIAKVEKQKGGRR